MCLSSLLVLLMISQQNHISDYLKYFFLRLKRVVGIHISHCHLLLNFQKHSTLQQKTNLLFDNQRFNDVEILYKDLLNDSFDGFALNRLIDILLEKNEKSEASELVDKFLKSEHACHSIRLNKVKLEIDNFEVRKSISTLCNEMIRDEIII